MIQGGEQRKGRATILLLGIRCVFVLILAGTASKIAQEISGQPGAAASNAWYVAPGVFAFIMLIGAVALGADIAYPRKSISSISAIFFGLMVGSILAYFLRLAIGPTLEMLFDVRMISWLSVVLSATISYICVSILLQTQDDFRFVIPYVEFRPQPKGAHPLVLDSSVIIDGRIADIAESGLTDQVIVIPQTIVSEVQALADSSDKIRRKRGMRGLEVIDHLRNLPSVEVEIRDDTLNEQSDSKEGMSSLIRLCLELGGRLVTNDLSLAKAAKIQNVETININAVSNALKAPVLWGDRIKVELVKEGEEAGQGVGYLDDGTMVVVEMGKRFIGQEINVLVEHFLQTNAGRMVFGRIDSKNPSATSYTSAAEG